MTTQAESPSKKGNGSVLRLAAHVFFALGVCFLSLSAYSGLLGAELQNIATKLQMFSFELTATPWGSNEPFRLTVHPEYLLLAVFVFRFVYGLLPVRRVPVYLLDFEVAQPAVDLLRTKAEFMDFAASFEGCTPETLAFQQRILDTNGLGEFTAIPRAILFERKTTVEASRAEFVEQIFPAVESALARSKVEARDIDIIIVNCSLFNPTPSMAAMIINKFGMRHDVQSYNLSGMGCSAGLISIHLAKDLLQVHRNARALVVSTEILSRAWYHGRDKSMLLSNTLFRPGAAAIVLSNHPADKSRARYRLLHTIRVNTSATDNGFCSIYQTEDEDGRLGVRLARAEHLLRVAGDAIRRNLLTLGPLVLPYSEQIKFFISVMRRRWAGKARAEQFPLYVPDWKTAVKHFCIHAGGRAIVDGVAKNLQLGDEEIAPSRETLKQYGNTSSSSVWYELRWIEDNRALYRGEKIFQIAFGAGFKCNTAVWQYIGKRSTPRPGAAAAAIAAATAAARAAAAQRAAAAAAGPAGAAPLPGSSSSEVAAH